MESILLVPIGHIGRVGRRNRAGSYFRLLFAKLQEKNCACTRKLDVPTNRITGILNGQRAITGDAGVRLAHFFGTSAEFWLNLQSLHERIPA
jgi:addiction module HigA family antidote